MVWSEVDARSPRLEIYVQTKNAAAFAESFGT
jgi:hypothetical protein